MICHVCFSTWLGFIGFIIILVSPVSHVDGNFVIMKEDNIFPNCRRYVNSRKYSAECMNITIQPSFLLPVLVTGLGGSGTTTLAELLTKLNLKLFHEDLGPDGSVVSLSTHLPNLFFIAL